MISKRRTTLAEVAGAAGVSIATVSKVLNDRADVSAETRRRVQDHLRATDYRPTASRLARQNHQSRLIEVLFSTAQNAYRMAVLDGIASEAQAEGFEIVLGYRLDSNRFDLDPKRLRDTGRAGAILLTLDPPQAHLDTLREAAFPLVVVDPPRIGNSDSVSIGATNFTGGLTATQHLLSLGHRRIGHAGGPHSVDCSQARLAGYSSALRQSGIQLDESLITHGGFTYDAGRRAAHELLDRADRPTAIFAASDETALGVTEEARRRGIRVPEDLSVVGFDDTFLAPRATPPLTTVAQPLVEMGRVAVRSLIQLIGDGAVATSHIELATRLVIRDSTAPPS
jgi:LacI family transcriptional regulator